MRLSQGSGRGFTLIELLLVIGMIAILASIVITAVAPTRQLAAANDSWRHSAAREMQSAIMQYIIDEGAPPPGVPSGPENQLPICTYGIASSTCVPIDPVVSGNYLVSLPEDSAEASGALIGFNIYREEGGFIRVVPAHMGEGGGARGNGPVCGNGAVEFGEVCDDGNLDQTDDCAACQIASCGDGYEYLGEEECDDGNVDEGDGCDATCVTEECGNAIQQFGEECDDGGTGDDDGCSSTCFNEICGDNIQQSWEQCDDGNTDPEDGCDTVCNLEV